MFPKIFFSLLLLIGFGLIGFGLFQCFAQGFKVALEYKNPYFPSNYSDRLKFLFKKGLIKLLLGIILFAASTACLNYFENGKFGWF